MDPVRVLKYAVYEVAREDRYSSRVLMVSNPKTSSAFTKSVRIVKNGIKVMSRQGLKRFNHNIRTAYVGK